MKASAPPPTSNAVAGGQRSLSASQCSTMTRARRARTSSKASTACIVSAPMPGDAERRCHAEPPHFLARYGTTSDAVCRRDQCSGVKGGKEEPLSPVRRAWQPRRGKGCVCTRGTLGEQIDSVNSPCRYGGHWFDWLAETTWGRSEEHT